MGVMNVTPDSFYGPSRVVDAEMARSTASGLIDDGADWIDIGGESTRPGAAPIDAEEELGRVAPVLDALAAMACPISVDTYHAQTARAALSYGVSMINDITAFRGDPDMAGVVADSEAACVLMHMQGNPETMQKAPKYRDVVDDICAFFDERLGFAQRAGIDEERIWLDPGFGFGKTVRHNLDILMRLGEFRRFGRPVLIGTSNKSTIGRVLGTELEDRLEGTAATVAIAGRVRVD